MRVRYGWAVAGLVLASVVAVVWWLPARWVMPLLEPRLRGVQLNLVRGRLWDGHADQVLTAGGRNLGTLHWKLSHRLLLGEVVLRLDLKSPSLRFGGELHQLAGNRQEWRDVSMWIDLDMRKPPISTAEGAPRGTLEVTVPFALLQGNWPLQLEGWAQWHDAAWVVHGKRIALGRLRLLAQGDQGILHTQLHDVGEGPLAVDGEAELSPIGWHLNARLHPRTADPALHQWIATLGAPQTDGVVHVERSGGLATALPAGGTRP